MGFHEKRPVEEIILTFDMSGLLETGETITGVTAVDLTVCYGKDVPISLVKFGAPQYSASKITQEVRAGVHGVDYMISVTFATSLGRVLNEAARLPVRNATA